MNNNKPIKAPTSLERLSQAFILLGMIALVFTDVVVMLLLQLGFSDSARMAKIALSVSIMAPVGIALLIYARRHAMRDFIVEVRRHGITKTLENIAERRSKGTSVQAINDPLAARISWSPVKLRTLRLPMKLHQQGQHILIIGYRHWPFYGSGLLICLAAFLAFTPFWATATPISGLIEDEDLLKFIQDFSLVLCGAGVMLAVLSMIPLFGTYHKTIMDKRKGTLAQVQPGFALRRPKPLTMPLSKAYAVQLLSYKTNSSRGPEVRYEMNLVLDDGNRLYLMSGFSLIKLSRNAGIIAEYLHLPVWDKTHAINDLEVEWMRKLDDMEG